MQHKAIQHLAREHARLEQFLSALDPLLAPPRDEAAAGAHVRELLERFVSAWPGIERHMAKEEALFAVLERHLPRDHGPLSVLRSEHVDVFQNFSRMREAATPGRRQSPRALEDVLEFARTTVQVIRDHMYKEDRVLFPLVARLLAPDADAELLVRMEGMDRLNREANPAGEGERQWPSTDAK